MAGRRAEGGGCLPVNQREINMHPMMKCVAAVSGLLWAGAVLAAPPQGLRQHSPDLQDRSHTRLSHLLQQANPHAPAVSDADVGDADSFGRNVVYAGLLASSDVNLAEDCSPGGTPLDNCVTVASQPLATAFDFEDLAHITLPAKTTHSFLCFHTTTYHFRRYQNETSNMFDAHFRYEESVTLESDLLNDPSLIDPTTGLPFNGKIRNYIGTDVNDRMSMMPGQSGSHSEWSSRTCQGGLISKNYLTTEYNLPQSVVDQFFKHPITLRLNIEGNAGLVTDGYIITGIRFYGD
ncbi:MAG TPA: hypothetical protein VF022_10690 [Rhodanobacteraceae bacterium]